PMIEPKLSGEFGTLMGWADSVRKLGVRVNADTPEDARTAIKFGGEGIGLCRTEHMFFEETRIRTVREMILAEDEQARRAALSKLLPMQRADFVELFEIMKGLPVTVRLLDPPLHEFLPHTHAEIEEVARAMNTDPRRLADRARELPWRLCREGHSRDRSLHFARSRRCRRARQDRRCARAQDASLSQGRHLR